jgi:anti-sigma factor RsiW
MTGQRRVSEAELHALVDGELSAEEAAEVDALLAASPPELGLAREFRDLNDALKARYAGRLAEPVPPGIARLAARLERKPSMTTFQMARAATIALMVAAAAGGGYLARGLLEGSNAADTAFVATAVAAHVVYVPEVRHPVEVKADEAHLVRWLTKRVGADVRAPSLESLGWRLMGGRLLPDQEGLPAAQFMYEDGSGRRMTLYVRKETGRNNTSFRFYERGGCNAFYWIDQPLAYALSGKLSREELLRLADAAYAQLETPAGSKAPAEPPRQPQ